MEEVRYVYNPERGKLLDFLAVFNMGLRAEKYENIFANLGFTVPPRILNSFYNILSHIPKDNYAVSLFCTISYKPSTFLNQLLNFSIKDSNSVDDLIDVFKKYTPETLINKLLDYYDEHNSFSERFYSQLLKNSELLTEYIDGLKISAETKWNITRFINSPEMAIKEFTDVLYSVRDALDTEYEELKDFREDYYKKVESSFKTMPDLLLDAEYEEYDRLKSLNICSVIQFTVILFIPYAIQAMTTDNQMDVYLGYEYEKAVSLIKSLKQDKISIFKAFADSTRVAIVEILKKQEVSVSELTKIMNMPMSSLSHHLDILHSANIINKKSSGKSVILSLRKDTILQASRMLSQFAA